MTEGWSVEQAAALLGVSSRQVRGLIGSGQLSARRLGSVWTLDPDSVRARARQAAPPGRPFAPSFAWDVLLLLDALSDAAVPGRPDPAVWNAFTDRRVRHRLRAALAHPRSGSRWRQALSARARRLPVWVHPGVVDRIADDPRLSVGGSAAAAFHQVEAAGLQPRRWYVYDADLDDVLQKYRLKRDESSPYDLMVIPAAVPPARRPSPGRPVMRAVALADLLASADARERHAAESRLEPLCLAGDA